MPNSPGDIKTTTAGVTITNGVTQTQDGDVVIDIAVASDSQQGLMASADHASLSSMAVNKLNNAFSASTPSRSIGTAFQPNPSKACWVSYSVDCSSSLSLSGNQEGKFELFCDASSSPTTLADHAFNGNSGALTIGLSLVQKVGLSVSCLVPAGHYVKLVTTSVTGSPTFSSIVSQREVSIG